MSLIPGATVAIVVVGFLAGSPGDNLHNGLLALSFAVVGEIVLRHRPGQREAMLFLATGAAQAVVFLGRQVGGQPNPGIGREAAQWIAWLGVWTLPLVLVLVGLTIMSFPDGWLPGRPWRVTFRVMVIFGSALALMSALWPVDYDRAGIVADHPFQLGGADTAEKIFERALPVVFTAFQLVWVACVVTRYRRASPAEARQLRWLVASAAMSVVALVGGLVLAGSPQAGLLTATFIPIACGAAIVEASYESLVREVQSAATRVVAAEDEARRRIERDLHDGAQHRLVVVGMELGRVVERAEQHGDPELSDAAQAARHQLMEATAELRELARGIHPSVLTNDGLAAALASLADRSPLPVELDVELPGRAAPQAEATAYFVASEALTNSARHSRATRATVRVVDNGSTLDVEVSDNGCGGAALGTGLGGLIDRVTSLGGSFVLDSPPGGGTRLSVQIPSAST
ncbi:MAG: hypothetical protein IPM43_03035 [Actinomycetota bacterium]|nr:MAG: hypothetical protein IPM43_03035 [Actinomycetota bacterium]